MDASARIFSPSELVEATKPLMESCYALHQVLTSAMQKVWDSQSESCAAAVAETALCLAPALTPGEAAHSAWQIPSWYQSQADRWVRSTLDSFAVLSQSQNAILELMGASLSQTAQKAASAISELNGTFASRRLSSQVIDFSDRRAMAQSRAA